MMKLTKSTYKKLDFLIGLVFIATILALGYAYLKYLFWPTAPFVFAFLIGMILQKPLRASERKFKKKGAHTFFSIFYVILTLLIIFGPVALILSLIITQISDFVSALIEQMSNLPAFLNDIENWLLDVLKFLPDSAYASVSGEITEFINNVSNGFDISSLGINGDAIKNGITSGVNGIYSVAKNIPSVAIGLVIGIIATIYFTKDYRHITKFISRQMPDGKKNLLPEIKHIFSTTVVKLIKSYGIIMLITFSELFISFSVMKMLGVMTISYIPLIALCITLFDILPVAGTGGILIPWALISLILGNYKQAIGVIVTYILITIIRQYVEPKVIGNSLGVHPLITLAGMYFGLKLFGFLGMIVVPLCIMTVKAFNDSGRIKIYKTDRN